MRNLTVIILTILMIGSVVTGQMTNSKHDFNGDWGNTETCNVCHTPHDADLTVGGAPLWNHEVTTATFTPYTSGTVDATMGAPNGASKLCLSCHDGTVAMDNFGGTTGGTDFIGGSKNLGTDMKNDHPVSFTYDDALASSDGELHVPSSASSGLGGTIGGDLLISGNMECSSCHDVHNSPGTVSKLLVKSNAGSALCLTCHNK